MEEQVTAPDVSGEANTPAPDSAPASSPEKASDESLDSILDKALGEVGGDDDDLWADEPTAEAQKDGPDRDEHGRFKAKSADEPEEAKKDQVDGEEKPDQQKEVEPAPSGVNAEAWAKADPQLRADVARRYNELESGIQQYQQFVEPLRPHIERAREGGYDFAKVVDGWANYEGWMRQDPVAGIQYMAKALNIDVEELALGLLDATGGEQQAPQINVQAEVQRQVQAQVQAQMQAIQAQQAAFAAQQQVEAFRASAPRFEELRPDMFRLAQSGFAADAPTEEAQLRQLYEYAERLKPAPAPQPQFPQAHTLRAVNKTVSGAPSGGDAARPRARSIEEALERGFNAVFGS